MEIQTGSCGVFVMEKSVGIGRSNTTQRRYSAFLRERDGEEGNKQVACRIVWLLNGFVLFCLLVFGSGAGGWAACPWELGSPEAAVLSPWGPCPGAA